MIVKVTDHPAPKLMDRPAHNTPHSPILARSGRVSDLSDEVSLIIGYKVFFILKFFISRIVIFHFEEVINWICNVRLDF